MHTEDCKGEELDFELIFSLEEEGFDSNEDLDDEDHEPDDGDFYRPLSDY